MTDWISSLTRLASLAGATVGRGGSVCLILATFVAQRGAAITEQRPASPQVSIVARTTCLE